MENNKDFTCYYIGQKYDKVMKGDGAVFELVGEQGYINIGFTDMSNEEIAAISCGKLDIYLSVIEGLVFITANFDNILILDMPFNAGLYPEFNIENPAPGGYTVPIIAVDNKDNIIRALRVVGFDPEFSSKLYSFAKKQWEERLPNFDEKLQSVYDRYYSIRYLCKQDGGYNIELLKNKLNTQQAMRKSFTKST